MKNNNNTKVLLGYIVFFVALILIASMLMQNTQSDEVVLTDIIKYFEEGKITGFEFDEDNTLTLTLEDSRKVEYTFRDYYTFIEFCKEPIEELTKSGVIKEGDIKGATVLPWWVSLIPYVIVIVAFIAIWWLFISRMSKGGSGTGGGGMGGGLGGRMNSFSKARTKLGADETKKVLFTDVAGADEEKEELQEVVEFLKNPQKFSTLGARIPKGVLLVGAPGTGKTLLAKAVAGESGVPFYSISGSDFVEMYVGVGASRVRDLFDTAKKTAPCIIFIDEIDAVGRHRGAGWGGGHDEREQTLNQLLVEMDGFGVNDGVIVIAATNRPDILDPALLRPGRFDRQVTVSYPDIKGRVAILQVHARNKPFEEQVDFEVIARTTAGFTGADLANLLNEAALLSARKGKALIGMTEIEESIIKIMVGPQKKSLIMKDDEKKKTAYHEAGHAIVTRECKTQDPVHQISIIPSGRALGYTLSLPKTDKVSIYKKEIFEMITMLLAGRGAEELVLDDISSGATNDMERATDLARKMVTQYGMSDVMGPMVYGSQNDEVFLGRDFQNTRNYSEEVASLIDKEINSIIIKAYEKAKEILNKNMEKLHFISEYLFKNEIMDGEQFELCFAEGATFEMIDEIRERKKSSSEIENERKYEQNKKDEEKRKKEEEQKKIEEQQNGMGSPTDSSKD